MRIKKQPGRKLLPSPVEVSDFVNEALRTDESRLLPLLRSPVEACRSVGIGNWPFPKSDLFHWMSLLDKFDDLMAKVIDDLWDKDTKLQKTPFSNEGRELLSLILEFIRLLLENCSSRNIFCSYDRLKKFLVADDLVILEKTLELLLIPARKLDSQMSLRNTFEREIGTDELAILAQLTLPFIPEMGELEQARFALNFREYHSKRLAQWTESEPNTIQYLKMLATAIFLMAQPDGAVDSAFFAMSPTLVADTAKLISTSPKFPMKQEMAALSILRSCLKSTSRWNELLHSLSLSASHGPMASIFRAMVDSIVAFEEIPYTSIFIYAYLDFISVLTSQVELDDSFVNSGVVAESIRSIESMHHKYYKIFEKILYILDSLIHHYATALDLFFSYNGLNAIVKQITGLIDSNFVLATSDSQEKGSITHGETVLLQCLLRFVDKLLNTNGADDRLRHLLEGPIFKSIAAIFNRPENFAVEILSHSASIVSNFIHNEPTSLTVLQELGTPQSLISCLKQKIPHNIELLSKIPFIFSAICLNTAGSEMFAQLDPVETLFSSFLDVEMLKMLRLRSTASSLGTGMDEFVRHHPQFRKMVVDDIIKTLKNIPSFIEGSRSSNPELFVGCQLEENNAMTALTSDKRTEPLLSQVLESFSSFIEGLVQTPSHAREFIDSGGVTCLMDVIFAKGVSFDFTIYNESLTISHMLRILSDVDAEAVIKCILSQFVKKANILSPLLDREMSHSFFAQTLSNEFKTANELFSTLCSMLAIVGLLRDLYTTHSYTFVRVGSVVVNAFTSTEGEASLMFLTIFLKACSWEFGHFLSGLDDKAIIMIHAKAMSDFKTPVYANFNRYLSLFRSFPPEVIEGVDKSSIPTAINNSLYLLFLLQRLITTTSSIFSGLSKMICTRGGVNPDQPGFDKLLGLIANSAINNLEWVNDTKFLDSSMRSFLLLQIVQFLSSIIFDETGNRVTLMTHVLRAFVKLDGCQDLNVALNSALQFTFNDSEDIGPITSLTLKELYNFFNTISNRSIKSHDVNESLYSLRILSSSYCQKFLLLPDETIRKFGTEILSIVLSTLSELILSSKSVPLEFSTNSIFNSDEGQKFLSLSSHVLDNWGNLCTKILDIDSEVTIQLANIIKSLLTIPKTELDAGNNSLVTEKENYKNVDILFGFILANDCPLSLESRFRILAASINNPCLSHIFPLLMASLDPIFKSVIESKKANNMACLRSGVLLISEIIYLSTLPIVKVATDETERSSSFFDISLSPELLSQFCLFSIELLQMEGSDLDLDFSTLYLVAALTKFTPCHAHFKIEELVPMLFKISLKCLSSNERRYRSLATLSTLILRHFIEVEDYLTMTMQSELVKQNSYNSRNINTFTSLPDLENVVCRDFRSFRKILEENFTLVWTGIECNDPLTDCVMTLKNDLPNPPLPKLEQWQTLNREVANKIIGTLMTHLMKFDQFPNLDSAELNEKSEADNSIIQSHFHRCAIIIAIIELIQSYPVCRESLLNSPTLNDFLVFLFDKMTPSGELAGSLGSRIFVNEPMWVSHLLDEICVGPSQVSTNERVSSIPGRVKIVVDALSMALKRFLSFAGESIGTYEKISRAWCLTMTVYVLISVKGGRSGNRLISPVQSAIAARMLEKGFASDLTSVLKNIDSKAPMAPMVAAKIIFALETLTRIGNRLTRIAAGQSISPQMEENLPEMMDIDDMNTETDDDMSDDDTQSDIEMGSASDSRGDDFDTEDEMEVIGYSDDDDDYSDSYTDDMDEEGTDFDDDHSDESSDMDQVIEVNQYPDQHYEIVVHPPVGRAIGGPASDALASGFQIIPDINGQGAFRADPFGIGNDQYDFFEDDAEDEADGHMGEYMSEEEDEGSMDDEAIEEGFSVDDYDPDAIYDENVIANMRPRVFGGASLLSRRQDLGITSYAAQVRDTDLFVHPLILNSNEQPRTFSENSRIQMPHRLLEAMPAGPVGSRHNNGRNTEVRPWVENHEIFHTPVVISTLKRWMQEVKLFIGSEEALRICQVGMPLLLNKLVADAMERREQSVKDSGNNNDENVAVPTAIESQPTEQSEESASAEESSDSSSMQITPSGTTGTVYEDSGPDKEFLEALPFEMRREVLEQYFEERRRNIPDGAEVRINQEFLNSLSHDLREDYVRLSDRETERYNRRSAGRNVNDFDFAAFLETFGVDVQRHLEEAIGSTSIHNGNNRGRTGIREARVNETEQVEEIIEALSESMRRIRNASRTGTTNEEAGSSSQPSGPPLGKKDNISMVDITSLATILRLYYDPLMTEHRTHMKLLKNLCVCPSTRADLLNMLIFVLEEMPEDGYHLDLVLEKFVTMTRADSKANSGKATPKKRMSPSALKSTTDPFGGSQFVVIQQRTLQVLMQLVQHNDDVKKFFVSSYSSPWTIKRYERSSNKCSTITTKYPIVLLLACLDQPNFTQVPLLVESLLHLLQLVTQPLKDSDAQLPELPSSFVVSLVKAVIQSELGPKSFQYATQAFQNLVLINSAANIILNDLTESSIKQADLVCRDIASLTKVVITKDRNDINESLKVLSQPSSSQSRLLRCMKMLSSTILKPLKADEEQGPLQTFDSINDLKEVSWDQVKESASKRFWSSFFKTINECLMAIGEESDLYHVATGILPSIEAYFWHVRQSSVLLPEKRGEEEESVFSFADKNRVILNSMIRASPVLLTNGAFILLTKMPRVLDFDNKRAWFRQQLVKRGVPRNSLNVHVRRAHIFEDSYHAIMGRSGEEVKFGRLSIKFHEEEGLDAGGVTREWFAVLSRQMFDPNYALFKTSAVDKITYQPNKMSYINPDHLQYFTFVGRIIGKAIYDSRLLDCYFTRSFYKHIINMPVDFKDLEAVEPDFYKSLGWILDNDITDVMELTFSVEAEEFGIHKIIDLKPDGRNMAVTEANKKEYVRLVTEYKLTTAIKPQIEAFKTGFYEVVPASLISIFNEQELELLISGMPDIDVDDWKNNTEYSGYNVSSAPIQWFWRAVRAFDQEYRAKLLQFVTGTSKVPLDGFANLQGSNGIQKFQIHRDFGAKDRLPSAHTCFNQLDLPEYENYESLKDMLTKAINECSTGFGLV